MDTESLRVLARDHPDAVAFRTLPDGRSLTFGTWSAGANRLARGLRRQGIVDGDPVGLLIDGDEACDWVTAYVAIHAAGAVAVPVNTRSAPREAIALLADVGARGVIASASWTGAAEQAEATIESLATIVLTTRDHRDERSWTATLDGDASPPAGGAVPGAVADLVPTSGTTGRPKAVAVRHAATTTAPAAVGVTTLNAAPLFTTSGLLLLNSAIEHGMTMLFLSRFDAGHWLDAVELERPAVGFVVPAMLRLIADHPRFVEADLGSLSLLSVGSAPASPALIERFQQRLPDAHIAFGYGMTEFGAASSVPFGKGRDRPGTVGTPLPGVEIRIVDEDGEDVDAGATGEILVRATDRPAREYVGDPTTTADRWRDGWFHSGDLGHVDDEGFLSVEGRIDDVIIRGGHNIHPAEVEAALAAHDSVSEVAVAGVPHAVLGEDVVAWVTTAPAATVDVEELRATCLERLGDHKVPRVIHVVDELARNAAGKIVRSALVASVVEEIRSEERTLMSPRTNEPTTLVIDDVEAGVRRITLDRPEKRNPLTPRCVRELVDAIEGAADDRSVHAVIVRGAGPAFSSGYGILVEDLDDGDLPSDDATLRDDAEAMRAYGHAWARVWNARVPVIAQVHGACVAGGTDLAMHCDLVVVADDAELGFPPVRTMGVPPTHMWLYHVGPQWAKRLLLTGDRVTGRTAERIGLAVQSVPAADLDETVLAIARRMARVDRDLLAANKAVVNQGVELMGRAALQTFSAMSDAIGHTAESAERFNRLARSDGFKAAVADRDAPFAELGDDPISEPGQSSA